MQPSPYPSSMHHLIDGLIDQRLALFEDAELHALSKCLSAGFTSLAIGGELGAGEILRAQVTAELHERGGSR